jgi:dTDP-4-amino-4,6-dideoxygalactose transaminase
LEDASQAHGARWRNQPVGSFGTVSAFSLYPGKNLGAAGDAGIVTTNSEDIYKRLLMLRNLGSIEKYKHVIRGGNHRLDTIQAIVLKEKIKYLEKWNQSRRSIVEKYERLIENPYIILPKNPANCLPVHHVYPVRVEDRTEFTEHLDEYGIQWGMHYSICIEEMGMYSHLSKPNERALKYSKEMVSLPIHPFMTSGEIDYLCDILNKYGRNR